MEKIILVISFLFFSNQIFSQMVFSNGTGGGGWNDPSTWLGRNIPGITSNVVIAGTDSVNTESGAVCNDLTILSGGKFVTSVDTVGINGILTVEADAWYYNRTNDPTLPGAEVILDPQSYVVHSGSGTIGGPENNVFGNLVVQRSAGVVPGANLTIYGNLIVENSASNVVLRGVRPATGSQTHTVYGDVIIKKGILSCVDDTDPAKVGIWNIKGNVYVTDNEEPYLESRIGTFSSANAAGLGIINIDGDLIIQGGRLQAGTSSSQGIGTGIINLAGDLIMNSKSAVATNHAGPFSVNFVGTEPQTVMLDVNFNLGTILNDTVKAGSTVIFNFDTTRWSSSVGGDFIVEGALELKGNSRISGAGNFQLNPEAHLGIGSPLGITDSLGNIRVTGTRNFNTDSYYEYLGETAQRTGSALPAQVKGLIINNPDNVVLTTDVNVNASLDIINGNLDLNGMNITLGENGTLYESGGTVKGAAGKISIKKAIGTPVSVNVGGLGAVLSSAVDLGETSIERSHAAFSAFNNNSIMRAYRILPGQNNSLNATLRFYYDDSELNGLPEDSLVLVTSPDAVEGSWTFVGGSVNTAENYVEASGISEFSYWTLTDKNNSITALNEKTKLIEGPLTFDLNQNYPNPFNPSTRITFSIEKAGLTEISVYNILGQKLVNLLSEDLSAGRYDIDFDGSHFSSGIYYYKLTSGSYQDIKKMVLIK